WSKEQYILRQPNDEELSVYSDYQAYTIVRLMADKINNRKDFTQELQQVREKNKQNRYKWNLTNLTYAILALWDLGDILEQEPLIVHDPTQLRPPRERTLADYRDEVVNRLSTLPSYTAMCQLLQADGNTETVLVRCLKG